MTDHLDNLLKAINAYQKMNRPPAIEEPANDFEKVIVEHNSLQDLIAEVKKALKPIEAAEKKMRDGIAASLDNFYGDDLKEGVNTYPLSNGRNLKYTNAVTRSIDEPQIANVRAAFIETATADGIPTTFSFDSLLRIKHELDKKAFNEVSKYPSSALAVSRMIIKKPAASKIEVD